MRRVGERGYSIGQKEADGQAKKKSNNRIYEYMQREVGVVVIMTYLEQLAIRSTHRLRPKWGGWGWVNSKDLR